MEKRRGQKARGTDMVCDHLHGTVVKSQCSIGHKKQVCRYRKCSLRLLVASLPTKVTRSPRLFWTLILPKLFTRQRNPRRWFTCTDLQRITPSMLFYCAMEKCHSHYLCILGMFISNEGKYLPTCIIN